MGIVMVLLASVAVSVFLGAVVGYQIGHEDGFFKAVAKMKKELSK